MAEERRRHKLSFLEDLGDYKVASEDPDVRGWELVDRDNHVLGKVDHLLADVEKKRVRYLDVEPDSKMIEKDHEAYRASAQDGAHEYRDRTGDVHMIVPIGMARLDTDNHRVIADKVDKSTFLGGPRFSKGEPITHEQEHEVKTYYEDPVAHRGATTPTSEPGDVAYKSEHHTKGNENIGTRTEGVRRDVHDDAVRPETESPQGSAAGAPPSTESEREKTLSTEDDKHHIKASAENTGKSPVPDHDQRKPRTESESREELGSKMKGETHLGEDPQTREAQYRSRDSYAGVKGDQPENGHQDLTDSDESKARKRDYENRGGEDYYRGDNYDDDRFYNRKK